MFRSALLVLYLLFATAPATASDADDAMTDLLSLDDPEVRREWLLERLSRHRNDEVERRRWAAALVVVQALEDAEPAVLAVYLLSVLQSPPDGRAYLIRAARAGGDIDDNGLPVLIASHVAVGEDVRGQPKPGDPDWARYRRYEQSYLHIECIDAALETMGPGTVARALLKGADGFRYSAVTTWGVVRGDRTLLLGPELRLALERENVRLPATLCAGPERKKCLDLPSAEIVVRQHNERLRHRLNLREEQVMLLHPPRSRSWRLCLQPDGRLDR